MAPRFAVLLPVKAPGRGKRRLGLPDTTAIVRAFVLDTIAALRESSCVDEVFVVSEDAGADLGVPVLPDLGEGDLNTALSRAAARLARPAVAAVLPDLPCLRTADVDAALALTGPGRWFVADHTGTGTTLLAAVDTELAPAFGQDSAERHLLSGAHRIDGELASLRLDVDTMADLEVAVALGVGTHTEAALPQGEVPPRRGG